MLLEDQLAESLRTIRSHSVLAPKVGVILGSGLGDFASSIQHPTVIHYKDIPHFPVLSAAGHAGELILGYLNNVPIVAMRGRAHLYEGHRPNVATYGVRVMKALGVNTVVVSNAAGGLNPRFHVGELVIIDSHINLMNRNGVTTLEANSHTTSMGMVHRTAGTYDPELIGKSLQCASQLGFSLVRGTYLATLGPTYETRAEYRAFRFVGADMVGMSTVPEAIVAATIGLRVLAFSVITNVASPDSAVATSHDEVLDGAAKAQVKLTALLQCLLGRITGPSID